MLREETNSYAMLKKIYQEHQLIYIHSASIGAMIGNSSRGGEKIKIHIMYL